MAARILVVEDHPHVREILVLYLQRQGYEVIEADNGKAAIQKAMTEYPDVIIMDLRLPEIDGIEATVRLKKEPKTAHIPVIGCSASQDDYVQRDALEKGMVECLMKPIPAHVFKDAIERVLKQNR